MTLTEFKTLCVENPNEVLNWTIQTQEGKYIIIGTLINSEGECCLITLTKQHHQDCINVKNYYSICDKLKNKLKDTIAYRNRLSNPETIIVTSSSSVFLNQKHYCYIPLYKLGNNTIKILPNYIQQYIEQIQNELI